MLTPDEIKRKTGEYAATLVDHGMWVGLGTGSTVYWLIQELGRRCAQGLEIFAVPTSQQTAKLAAQAGVHVRSLDDIDSLPLTIDGADEIDAKGQLIKGGGGALLQEKIVASASDKLVIIADHSKFVQQLGKFKLPVEVIPFGYRQVILKFLERGLAKSAELRMREGKPFVSDHGHYILDCDCGLIAEPNSLNLKLHDVPGVVETGLFVDMADDAFIGHPDGSIEVIAFNK